MKRHLVAVRGTGSIGLRHARVLAQLGVDTLLWPAEPDRPRSSELSGFQVVRSLEELRQLAPQACVIATNTGRHLEDACELAFFSPHLLIEKPLAADLHGLAETRRQLEAVGAQAHVAFNLRFNRSLVSFRDQLPQIGPVHSVRIECQSYLPDWRPNSDYRQSYAARVDEGGVLRDLAHEVDYAIWLFGLPGEVFGHLDPTSRLGLQAEEAADLLWRTDAGTLVSLRLDYLTRPARRTMVAAGTEGTLSWDGLEGRTELRLHGSLPETIELAQERDAMMADQLMAFLASIDAKETGNLATFEDGAAAVAVSEAARLSSQRGAWEKVADWR